METDSALPVTTTAPPATTPATTKTPATTTPATTAVAKPASDTSDFTKKLAAELARIGSHATKVDTLANGAKLYHLAGGREVEAAPGKSPYVAKKGDWHTKTAAPAAAAPTTTAPATTAPATTAPPATTPAPATGTTAPVAPPATTPAPAPTTAGTGTNAATGTK